MKKINFVNGTTIDGAKTFNDMQNNVEEVFNGEEAMGSIVVDDITSSNLFNPYNATTFGYLGGAGDVVDNADHLVSEYILLNRIGKITTSGSRSDAVGHYFYDENKNFIPNSGFSGNKTQEIPANAKYIRCTVNRLDLNVFQLKYGEETDYTPYKKYGYNSQESMGSIVVDDIRSKNLISGFTPGLFYNSVNNVWETGTTFSTSNFIDVEVGETYIFSHGMINGIGGFVGCFDENDNFLESINNDTMLSPFTITNENCKKIICVSWDPNNNPYANEKWMQLEKGSVATPYTPYKEFSNKHIYSTNEHIVGTWTDGRDIYEKTIVLTSGWNVGGQIEIPHYISDFDRITDCKVSATRLDGLGQVFPNYFNSDWILDIFDFYLSTFRLWVGSGFTGARALTEIDVTLQYVKNTQPAMMYSPRPDKTDTAVSTMSLEEE